jgi:copper chaperone NosL
MKKLFGKPDAPWLISAIIAGALLVAAIFVPLWRMELIAPQYPAGLVLYAYGDHFQGETEGYYSGFDAVREINALNHYIGMKPLTRH